MTTTIEIKSRNFRSSNLNELRYFMNEQWETGNDVHPTDVTINGVMQTKDTLKQHFNIK